METVQGLSYTTKCLEVVGFSREEKRSLTVRTNRQMAFNEMLHNPKHMVERLL